MQLIVVYRLGRVIKPLGQKGTDAKARKGLHKDAIKKEKRR